MPPFIIYFLHQSYLVKHELMIHHLLNPRLFPLKVAEAILQALGLYLLLHNFLTLINCYFLFFVDEVLEE